MAIPTTYDFDKLWNYSKPAETEDKFREILAKTDKPADWDYYLQLLTQIARTQGLQMKFEEGHQTLEEVFNNLKNAMPATEMRYFLEKGRLYNSSGDKETANSYFKKAWDFGNSKKEDYYALDAAHMIAIVVPKGEQNEWNEKALYLAEHSEDERCRRWIGSLLNNIGWTYHDLQNHQKALDFFIKTEQWYDKTGNLLYASIGRWSQAKMYRFLGETDKALGMQLEILQLRKDNQLMADYVYEELGELYFIKKDIDKAKENFQLAYEKISQDPWMVKNEAERLNRMKRIAETGRE